MKKIIYLLIAFVATVFLSFQTQKDERFYYAFNEKISLDEVENKLVVRYSEGMNKENVSKDLRTSYANSFHHWHDDRTVILSVDSKIRRDEAIESFQKLSQTVSCQPLYKISTGLEMIVTDEFVVKFKKNVRAEEQQKINQRFGASTL